MNAVVTHESLYGNTRQVADAIATGLVTDAERPLVAGELERARAWGVSLAAELTTWPGAPRALPDAFESDRSPHAAQVHRRL